MAEQHADEIWTGGMVDTLDSAHGVVEALAIADGRLMAVGSDADIRNLAGPDTKERRLGGQYVMPGLVESHTHALWGACRDLFDVFVGYEATLDQLLNAVKERTAKLPPGEILIGGPWRLDMCRAMGSRPRDLLDKIAPNNPVVLQDTTQHSLWCNSAALAMASLDAATPDFEGGTMERDPATGEPNGILAEEACGPVRQKLVRTEAQCAEAARYFCKYFNSLGFTAFKEPMAFEADLKAYKAADERSELTLHMAAHLTRSSPLAADDVPYDTLEGWRAKYATENIRTDFAKLFLDGVAPSHTASFLEPYLESSGYDAASHAPNATLLIKPDALADTVTELDRRRFAVKMHAVGDNAARAGLNAIEAARKRNRNSNLRHEIAHCPFIHPDDRPRFALLNVIAEMSPKLWFPNAVTAGQHAVLGKERTEQCHPIRSLMRAGAEMTYASDWPAAAPDANPWTGLAGMITRRNVTGAFPGTVGAGEAIALEEALPLFTINGARSLGMEAETGTLSPGKWADFIVLDAPLNLLSGEEIGATQVRETIWKGQTVFAS